MYGYTTMDMQVSALDMHVNAYGYTTMNVPKRVLWMFPKVYVRIYHYGYASECFGYARECIGIETPS